MAFITLYTRGRARAQRHRVYGTYIPTNKRCFVILAVWPNRSCCLPNRRVAAVIVAVCVRVIHDFHVRRVDFLIILISRPFPYHRYRFSEFSSHHHRHFAFVATVCTSDRSRNNIGRLFIHHPLHYYNIGILFTRFVFIFVLPKNSSKIMVISSDDHVLDVLLDRLAPLTAHTTENLEKIRRIAHKINGRVNNSGKRFSFTSYGPL